MTRESKHVVIVIVSIILSLVSFYTFFFETMFMMARLRSPSPSVVVPSATVDVLTAEDPTVEEPGATKNEPDGFDQPVVIELPTPPALPLVERPTEPELPKPVTVESIDQELDRIEREFDETMTRLRKREAALAELGIKSAK